VFYLVVSYNQPKFSPCASWNANAILVTNINTVDLKLFSILINTSYTNSSSLLVTLNGYSYVNNSDFKNRVNTWIANPIINPDFKNIISSCSNLFIGLDNSLYCSTEQQHTVLRFTLNPNSILVNIVAGKRTNGTTLYLLSSPNGIFVDINYDLYVADSGNDRIQLFRHGHLNGTTIAGNKALGTTVGLNFPTGIVLDADGYLFIADRNNHRIIRSNPNGFRCIVGCSRDDSASNQFFQPRTLWFDSDGNIFILNNVNNGIEKFLLTSNSCGKFDTCTPISTLFSRKN
jgi:hypothetical protein